MESPDGIKSAIANNVMSFTNVAHPVVRNRKSRDETLYDSEWMERPSVSGQKLKRAFDILAASMLFLVLAVPMAIIAFLVKVTSKGSVFYSQERVGLHGRHFQIYKFRSMHLNAESQLGPVWATSNDPRQTAIGRIMRRTSLDELPQIWNVIRGDMSLVGPRPERPFFVERFSQKLPEYSSRHKVPPGLTGWAQVNGWFGNTSLECRLEHDLHYVKNWSLGLDLKILLLTPWCVLRGHNGT